MSATQILKDNLYIWMIMLSKCLRRCVLKTFVLISTTCGLLFCINGIYENAKMFLELFFYFVVSAQTEQITYKLSDHWVVFLYVLNLQYAVNTTLTNGINR